MQIERLLREQAGVISRSQAVAAGMSTDQVDRRLRNRRWQRQQLLDRALQRRVRYEDLIQAYSRNLGWRGSKAAGDLLRSCADRAASEGERVVIRLMRVAGITGWVRGYWFGGCELDFAFPEQRVAVEVDGWAWHVDVERFRHDRRKQNALELAGWTVLSFTWHDLTQRPEQVVAEIKSALARRSAA